MRSAASPGWVESPSSRVVNRARRAAKGHGMKNWKEIAAANNLNIPDADMERIQPALEKLEAAFRPMVKSIPHETEPAITFVIPREAGE
jgi:hypothetical protein